MMPKNKTEVQRAAGKLISQIQKVWGNELGVTNADFSENVMDSAHDLLQAKTAQDIEKLLDTKSVRQYLGDIWVQKHPSVKLAIERLESAIKKDLS